MKVAESYVRELLERTEPLTAVTALSKAWAPRIDESRDDLGLSRPEHDAQMYLLYTGEVVNGGHAQLFANHGRKIAERIGSALDRMAAAAARARKLPGTPYVEYATRELGRRPDPALLAASDAFAFRQLCALVLDALTRDDEFSDLDSAHHDLFDADERLLRYLRLHGDELLIPERAE